MNIRGIGDGFALQRLLWLLVGTVVVPTVLLSLFGVMAIRNQRAAFLQQVDQDRVAQLEIGARALEEEVGAFEGEARRLAKACEPPFRDCTLGLPLAGRRWAWTGDVPAELQALGVSREMLTDAVLTWVTPADAPPIAVLAHGEVGVAWMLAPDALIERLTTRLAGQLEGGSRVRLDAPNTAMEDAIARLLQPTREALALPRPLSGWRLRIEDDRPAWAAMRRNFWLYPVSLGVLVALVLFGAFVTLGTAAREIRLSQLQTDFVSSVSHELRTPLTSIRMFVETLQSGRLRDPAKVQEALDLVALETERLSRMIERVLDWARMEAGRRVYDLQPTTVESLIGRAVQALRSQTLLSDEPLRIELPDDLPNLRVDEDAIVQALVNLLQNALRYTPEPREIVVGAVRARGEVGLTVRDNGPGIPRAEHRRIFEKFYQVDARLSSPSQGHVDRGSGLGLAIVRAVARAHGGRVTVESEPGAGSCFTVWLPVPGTTG